MIFLFETELPDNKSVIIALTYIYGLGKSKTNIICKKLGFSINFKIKELSNEQIEIITLFITSFSNLNLSLSLKKIRLLKKKQLLEIKSYRGLRLNQGLPVRGQRTHTNAKSARIKNKKVKF